MAHVLRSPYGWRILCAAIAASMPAMAGASADRALSSPQSAAVHGTTVCGSNAAAESVPAAASERNVRAAQRSALNAQHFCFGPHTSACTCHGKPMATPTLDASRLLLKGSQAQAGTAGRVALHARMRVTRLQNGSILCCRERPHAHIVPASLNGSDDTASDGDEDSDDDDSQDDQNGNDDSDSNFVSWNPATVLYLGAPARKSTLSWIIPSFPLFLVLQQLRC